MKHIGRIKNSRRKCVIAYRVLPKDPDNCLIVQTESLNSDYHDAMMTALESNVGQASYEFAEAMHRSYMPDGRNMLAVLHREGGLTKYPTHMIEMTPNTQTTIMLDELNRIIAQQRGIAVADLALGPAQPENQAPEEVGPELDASQAALQYVTDQVDENGYEFVDEVQTVDEQPLSDEDLADSYEKQAATLIEEANNLQQMAEELRQQADE